MGNLLKKRSLITVNCTKASVIPYVCLFWSKMRVEISLHKIQDIHKVWCIGKVLTIVWSVIPFCKTFFNAMYEVIITILQHSSFVIQHLTHFMCAFIKVLLVPNFHHLNLIFTGNTQNKIHGTKVWRTVCPLQRSILSSLTNVKIFF